MLLLVLTGKPQPCAVSTVVQVRIRTHHWPLPGPKQMAVLAAKGWQLPLSCPTACAVMGGVLVDQCGIGGPVSPQSRQGWMLGPSHSLGSPNQACLGAKGFAVSS